MGLDAQPSPGQRHVMHHQRHLPLLANLPTMRHPVVCVGAKAVVNMHRPQRQRGILFPQQHQLMQKNRPPLKATSSWRWG